MTAEKMPTEIDLQDLLTKQLAVLVTAAAEELAKNSSCPHYELEAAFYSELADHCATKARMLVAAAKTAAKGI